MDTFEWYCKNDSPHYKQNNNQLQCSVKTVRLFYLMGGGGGWRMGRGALAQKRLRTTDVHSRGK